MVIRKVIKGAGAIPLIIIGSLLIIYFYFLPPVFKYIIENQGGKQPGRKVEVGNASLSSDSALINTDYPYFKITFDVDE
jgi:hypothetical protein